MGKTQVTEEELAVLLRLQERTRRRTAAHRDAGDSEFLSALSTLITHAARKRNPAPSEQHHQKSLTEVFARVRGIEVQLERLQDAHLRPTEL